MPEKHDVTNFLERAADLLDLPAEAVAGVTKVEITGNHQFLVENHKGILEYNDTEIKINGGNLIIKIVGQRLTVSAMNATEIALGGQIENVQFINI